MGKITIANRKMRNILSNKYFLLGIRVLVGLIFIFAAIEKIAQPEKFAVDILNYRLLPEFLVNIPAIILPWIELTTGLFLIFGIRTREVSLLLFVLLSTFTIAVIIAVIRGLDIECGCFGTLMAQEVGLRKILENFILLLLTFNLLLKGGGSLILKLD